MAGRLDDWAVFVQAVDSGGFTAAGRRLGCPKTTVSKRVAALEAACCIAAHDDSR
jgi:DNA-binding transcriptional LysR family regulator